MFDAYLGTTTGVFRSRGAALEALGLPSEHVSAIHARREGDGVTVLAGSYGNGPSHACARRGELLNGPQPAGGPGPAAPQPQVTAATSQMVTPGARYRAAAASRATA
jgi:hypothetical protein